MKYLHQQEIFTPARNIYNMNEQEKWNKVTKFLRRELRIKREHVFREFSKPFISCRSIARKLWN